MEKKSGAEFELDAYLERLLRLRASDPVQFSTLPKTVREIVEQYEREKEEANSSASTHVLTAASGARRTRTA